MITQVSGKVGAVGLDWIDVDLGAVRIRVNAPTSTVGAVGEVGGEVRLFTSLQVREDSLTLYGFSSSEARSSFESLLGISGIGPRLALSVLSLLSTHELAVAVATDDVSAFSGVPGVGKKTAGRIILELKGSLGRDIEVTGGPDGSVEVIGALTALGYSLGEAREAAAALPPGSELTLEERVRAALERLGAD